MHVARGPIRTRFLTRFCPRAAPVNVTRAAGYANLPRQKGLAMHDTWPRLERIAFPSIRRGPLDTLQVNIGYRCNQSCVHCHVNAGPHRKEEMSSEVIDTVLAFLARKRVPALDITGGAPELNPHFRRLVRAARAIGVQVMDRCNLTILEVAGQEDLAHFLARERVEIVASLPCYLEENVDRQRGKGVFDASIRGLRQLNALGYGRAETGLVVNLVYNPQGSSLPPPQRTLEEDYRRVLGERYGVVFNRLYALANMPIQRFGAILIANGEFERYLDLLRRAHLDANLEHVMCRNLISVDWRGYIYDCDFNQMLDLPLKHDARERVHLSELLDAEIEGQPIRVAGHCYGCTAGQGSSCGGALAQAVGRSA
jgi:radical SAM/Cys-rich protein